MSDLRTPHALWPGLSSVIGCTYTCSHGISPGNAVLRFNSSAGMPAPRGNLLITDGVGNVLLRDCRLVSVQPTTNVQGRVELVAIIEDRRWRWRDRGLIDGWYNQLDQHAKLIPWTIRSPKELVEQCFLALGEKNVKIDLPPGLTRKDGERFWAKNPPWIGVKPVTGTNMPINWQSQSPAQALQQVADNYGRVVVYDPITDSILIHRPGFGPQLPPGSIARRSPSITPPQSADGIAVIGAPTRFQARFLLEAVGEEWDGSIRPIDTLSYAPKANQPPYSKFEISLGGEVEVGKSWKVNLTVRPAKDDPELANAAVDEPTEVVAASAVASTPSTTHDQIAEQLRLSIDGSRDFDPVLASVSRTNSTVTIIGRPGKQFFISVDTAPPGLMTIKDLSVIERNASWNNCPPPKFPNVTAVPGRLTRQEARDLASKCIWRYFRIVNCDPSNPELPLKIPGYPYPIKRRQQIVLLPTSVEQIVPLPPDDKLFDRNNDKRVTDFYNGYSHDRPAVVYGSVVRVANHRLRYLTTDSFGNTDQDSRVFVDFQIDPEEQMAVFSDYVYRAADKSNPSGPIQKPRLVLECACHVRDADTNQLARQQQIKKFGPGNTIMARVHDDVQANVIGRYNRQHRLIKTELLEADAIVRSNYYLAGLQAQIIPQVGDTAEYNGVMPVAMSGAISQVTWNVDVESGASTLASRNSEHDIYIPPFPARRRAEMLPPYDQLQRPQRARRPQGGLDGD